MDTPRLITCVSSTHPPSTNPRVGNENRDDVVEDGERLPGPSEIRQAITERITNTCQ